jgi:hypothetical protein
MSKEVPPLSTANPYGGGEIRLLNRVDSTPFYSALDHLEDKNAWASINRQNCDSVASSHVLPQVGFYTSNLNQPEARNCYRSSSAGLVDFSLKSAACANAPDLEKTENENRANVGADRPVDVATKKTVVENLATQIEGYTSPALARSMTEGLHKSLSEGKFDSINSSIQFAKALTEELRKLSNDDKHLEVTFQANGIEDTKKPTEEELRQTLALQKLINSGVSATKNGDLGFIKIDTFLPTHDPKFPAGAALTREAIDSAMKSLSGVKSLIIDLRENKGGMTDTALRVMSYLLPPGTHVNSIIWRNGNHDGAPLTWNEKENGFEQKLITADLGGGKIFNPETKIYVLTSDKTFSAGEELAYDLQATGRATVVGKVTKGGANPGGYVTLSPGFEAFIPTGRSSSPYTGGANWEHKGVKPDIEVKGDQDARQLAVELARQHK